MQNIGEKYQITFASNWNMEIKSTISHFICLFVYSLVFLSLHCYTSNVLQCRSIADGQSQHSFSNHSHRGYLNSAFPTNLVNSRPGKLKFSFFSNNKFCICFFREHKSHLKLLYSRIFGLDFNLQILNSSECLCKSESQWIFEWCF